MSNELVIRKASREEFAVAVDWATAEGWNPGLDDLEAFYAVDPEGFIMGWIGEKPVSSISVVRYGEGFGFLGFYIVNKDYRGTGVGIATWNAGLAHLEGLTIGLDGVVDQQQNYKKSGFSYVGRNVRFSGVPTTRPKKAENFAVRQVKNADLPQLASLDRLSFYATRKAFLHDWCLSQVSTNRRSLIVSSNDQIDGFGTIRKCQTGFKIAPLFAKTHEAAETLLASLLEHVEHTSNVTLDVPQLNSNAVQLAETMGLEPVFETARMLRGGANPIAWQFVYGITSFELG
ncbi:MAG: GNAT family N-acetyltransferase [Hyphomicrobiales bacterium]